MPTPIISRGGMETHIENGIVPVMAAAKKWLPGLFILILIGVCLLWPSSPGLLIQRLPPGEIMLASLPLILYALVGLFTFNYLWKVPPDAQQMEADKHQSASLTLAGFCFTSLSLLVSFFKEPIKAGEAGPEKIILFFACALACFIASYMALRYRTKNLFGFLSEAFVDNGFWCVMVGLWAFLSRTAGMKESAAVIKLLLIFYLGYLILNFYYHIHYVRKSNRRPQ
jgi:hypothetical protein